jgi:hypothetical protein
MEEVFSRVRDPCSPCVVWGSVSTLSSVLRFLVGLFSVSPSCVVASDGVGEWRIGISMALFQVPSVTPRYDRRLMPRYVNYNIMLCNAQYAFPQYFGDLGSQESEVNLVPDS